MTKVKSPTLRHARQCYFRRKDVAQYYVYFGGRGRGERLVTRGKHSKAPATRTLKETKNSSFELAGIRVTGIDSIFNSPLE